MDNYLLKTDYKRFYFSDKFVDGCDYDPHDAINILTKVKESGSYLEIRVDQGAL